MEKSRERFDETLTLFKRFQRVPFITIDLYSNKGYYLTK